MRTIIAFSILMGSLFPIGCSSEPKWSDYENGFQLIFGVASVGDSSQDLKNREEICRVMAKRLYDAVYRNHIMTLSEIGKIILQFPEMETNDEKIVLNLLKHPYRVNFQIVAEKNTIPESDKKDYFDDKEILYLRNPPSNPQNKFRVPFLLYKKIELNGEHILKAKVGFQALGEPYVTIYLDSEGSNILKKLTDENIGRQLAIVLDRCVYSAPVIKEKIEGGIAQIVGIFTPNEANILTIGLNSGTYPVDVRLVGNTKISMEDWLGKLD